MRASARQKPNETHGTPHFRVFPLGLPETDKGDIMKSIGKYALVLAAGVATAALSGCGKDPKAAAIEKAESKCLYELTETFPSNASYGIDHERKPEVTAEDAAAKRYEVTVPVYASGDRFPCYAVVEESKTKARFKR